MIQSPDHWALSVQARGLREQARLHAQRGERAQAERILTEHDRVVAAINAPLFKQIREAANG